MKNIRNDKFSNDGDYFTLKIPINIENIIEINYWTPKLHNAYFIKGKKIIVYCNAGSRSYTAYRKLMRMEYKNIYQSLFADWKEAGLEVKK